MRLHRLGAILALQAIPCAYLNACAIIVILTFIAHIAAQSAALRRRMRRNNKSETSRLIARQSKEKRDRRPESAQVTGCVMRREGAPIGVGCGIPLQAKRCACASAERILRHLSNRGLALRANRSDRAPRATAGNAGKQGGRWEDGGVAATDSHPKAIS